MDALTLAGGYTALRHAGANGAHEITLDALGGIATRLCDAVRPRGSMHDDHDSIRPQQVPTPVRIGVERVTYSP